jgi:phosphoribosylaminoimidazole-succinocarboxamide synthase
MMPSYQQIPVITETQFSGLNLSNRGKVRDIYDFGDSLLIVATDRLSAYDVVMNEGIPFKGKVLTQISDYWFDQTKELVRNHVKSTIIYDYPSACKPHWDALDGRSMWVTKTKPLPVECVVRGYLAGSGWSEYKSTKSVCGISLPDGLVESSRLSEPIFTPATKEELGKHDENISFSRMVDIVGKETAEKVRDLTIKLYLHGAKMAEAKGIIIADTKMEFGIDERGEIILIDELLTPDSSRFWPMDSYQEGKSQDSFDKQFVRDYLVSIDFNKRPPAPKLPDAVVFKTAALYLEALKRLTGRSLM